MQRVGERKQQRTHGESASGNSSGHTDIEQRTCSGQTRGHMRRTRGAASVNGQTGMQRTLGHAAANRHGAAATANRAVNGQTGMQRRLDARRRRAACGGENGNDVTVWVKVTCAEPADRMQ